MCAMRAKRLEPKRVRLIIEKPGAKPKLALLGAVKGAGSWLDWLPPLFLRDADGAHSAEYRRIYRLPLDETGVRPHNTMGVERQ